MEELEKNGDFYSRSPRSSLFSISFPFPFFFFCTLTALCLNIVAHSCKCNIIPGTFSCITSKICGCVFVCTYMCTHVFLLLIIKQLHALISQIYFRNKTLHVSDSSSVHHQEFFTVHATIGICHTGLLTAC